MLRKFALAMLLVLSLVTILPFARSAAHGIGQAILHRHHHRHHSRRWWRHHRAMMRRRQAARAHRNAPLAPAADAVMPMPPNVVLPSAVVPEAPGTWSSLPASKGQLRFKANAPGTAAGQATLAVVALSRPAPAFLTIKEQKQMLAGVSFSELRSTVIDRMVKEGGWVTNDFEREVGGRRVFIVTAQTPADGRAPDQAWNFYFTEVNGRIYSLTTQAGLQSAQRMATEAEKFITSLH